MTNLHNSYLIVRENKTIMDHAQEYVEQQAMNKNTLHKINKVRRAKRLYLPFELVRFDGSHGTNCYYNNKKVSSIQQSFINKEKTKLIAKDYELWNNFKKWLVKQKIITILDFSRHAKWLQTISEDRSTIVINDKGVIDQFAQTQFNEVYSKGLGQTEFKNGFIGRLLLNGVVNILSTCEEEDESDSEDNLDYNKKHSYITNIRKQCNSCM